MADRPQAEVLRRDALRQERSTLKAMLLRAHYSGEPPEKWAEWERKAQARLDELTALLRPPGEA